MKIKYIFLLVLISLFTTFISFGQKNNSSDKDSIPKVPGEIIECFQIDDEEAQFPGGRDSLNAFLANNIKFPQRVIKNKLKGKSYVEFVVNREGRIEDVTIKKSFTECPECDEEAIRVVKLMPKWEPGKLEGKPVKSTFILPFNFRF